MSVFYLNEHGQSKMKSKGLTLVRPLVCPLFLQKWGIHLMTVVSV